MLKPDKIFIAKKEDYEEKAEDLHVGVVHDCDEDDLINESIVSRFKKKRVLLSDLLLCNFPTEEDNVMSCVMMDVIRRLEKCMEREQLDDEINVIDRSIVCVLMLFRINT